MHVAKTDLMEIDTDTDTDTDMDMVTNMDMDIDNGMYKDMNTDTEIF